jgi:hypothetical protein
MSKVERYYDKNAQEPSLLGASDHLLYIGKKPAG